MKESQDFLEVGKSIRITFADSLRRVVWLQSGEKLHGSSRYVSVPKKHLRDGIRKASGRNGDVSLHIMAHLQAK